MNISKLIPDNSGDYKQLLSAAFTMAENAGRIHMRYFRKNGLEQSTKLNDSDVVTVADKEAEAFILNFIHQHFPLHGIISEESGQEQRMALDNRSTGWNNKLLHGTTGLLCFDRAGTQQGNRAWSCVRPISRRMFLCCQRNRSMVQR